MASEALQDQEIITRLIGNSLSPVNNYSQGLLSLAIDRQNRERQLQDQQTRMAADVALEQQREASQARIEKQRETAAHQHLIDTLELEHKFKTADQQENDRKAMVDSANEEGADLPANASYEEASKSFVRRHGENYIQAMKAYGQALQDNIKQSDPGQFDPKKFSARIGSLVADNPEVSAVLTPPERELIRRDPSNIDKLRAKYATSDKKKYNAITDASTAVNEQMSAEFTKAAGNKPAAIEAASRFKLALDDLTSIRKRGGISPEVRVAADQAYRDAVFPPQPAAPPGPNLPLPPPPGGAAGAPPNLQYPAPAGPPVSAQPGYVPGMIPQALNAAAYAPAKVLNPAINAVRNLPSTISSALPPSVRDDAASLYLKLFGGVPPPNPALANTLKRINATQDSVAPTAFPAPGFDQDTTGLE